MTYRDFANLQPGDAVQEENGEVYLVSEPGTKEDGSLSAIIRYETTIYPHMKGWRLVGKAGEAEVVEK